jgi:hypothetical protein
MLQYLVCSDSIVAVVVCSENDTCKGLLSCFPASLSYVSGQRIRAEVEEGVLVAKMFSAVVVVVRQPKVLSIDTTKTLTMFQLEKKSYITADDDHLCCEIDVS